MICINNIINPADLASIISLINENNNQDGSLTAGRAARNIKNNIQQFSGDALVYTERKLMDFFKASQIFYNYTFPKSYSAMRLVRYQKDMFYGKHSDNVMIDGIRTDLSFTLFLNDMHDYEGGYLRIYNENNSCDIKLDAGSIVIYPTKYYHEVTPVTCGERLVVVGWIQSAIQNPEIREILSNLANARDDLMSKSENTSSETYQKVSLSFDRLFRLYCTT